MQHLDLLGDAGGQVLDLVEQDQVDRLVHEVHDVVEPRGQAVDVLPVERRDEGAVDPPDDVVGGLVGGVLGVAHPLRDGLAVVTVAQHLGEQLGAVDQVAGGRGQQVVERRVRGTEAQRHGGTPELVGRAR